MTLCAPKRFGVAGDAREEVVGDAGWDAAARHDKFRPLRERRQLLKNRFPFRAMQLRPGQDEAILLAGRFLISGEILTRLDVRRRHDAVDALAIDKAVQELSDSAACRENCGHAAAKSMRDPGYVDTAAAWVTFRRRTAHFPRRLDAVDIDENVDGGIDRERDDIGHVRHPVDDSRARLPDGPLTERNRYFLVAMTISHLSENCAEQPCRPGVPLFRHDDC